MKKVILTSALMLGLMGASFAQNATDTKNTKVEVVNTEADDQGTEIKVSELPEAVQATLRSEKYADWKAQKAWRIEKDGAKWYKVEVVKGEEVKTLKFNESGEIVTN